MAYRCTLVLPFHGSNGGCDFPLEMLHPARCLTAIRIYRFYSMEIIFCQTNIYRMGCLIYEKSA